MKKNWRMPHLNSKSLSWNFWIVCSHTLKMLLKKMCALKIIAATNEVVWRSTFCRRWVYRVQPFLDSYLILFLWWVMMNSFSLKTEPSLCEATFFSCLFSFWHALSCRGVTWKSIRWYEKVWRPGFMITNIGFNWKDS